ncbi:membrane protein [Streptomyces sp. NRRL S-87]|uniref:membrane protein n=1 Tax=Streptomyces sp. NRRL S-87 TaxID=1463920 RepID=UPI0004C22B68|nr:membrane protein [Streptomyces sp. NRRL S-87]
MGIEVGALTARSRAAAVLRLRSRALAVALLPAAVAVVLVAARQTGRLAGDTWSAVTLVVGAVAGLVLLLAGAFGAVVLRAGPATTPTVPVSEAAAPDLYRLVRDLAERLEVPPPSAIALTPDCDSWLEDRTHATQRRGAAGDPAPRTQEAGFAAAPVLVIGSPFLWWMRVAELRAVLAPVVAGTGPSADPDIAGARRFVRGLDAAVDVGRRPGLGWVARLGRLLLGLCRADATEMERGVAAAASERAQTVDYGLRIVAQEQVGLAYAGWDRLLTRVALPAWRMGRWPSRLDAGVVSALTELSRRDRLAEGFASRLGERPACDLLEEPGLVDEAASLLAARLFHGGPAEPGPDWSPVDWAAYPEEVVDRKWRTEAARLHRALDALALPAGYGPAPTTLAPPAPAPGASAAPQGPNGPDAQDAPAPAPAAADPTAAAPPAPAPDALHGPTLERVFLSLAVGQAEDLAARLSADAARDERPAATPGRRGGSDELPLFPLQPPRSGRDLLADHVTAMVCCAAVDTAGAAPGLDWLDGPALLVGGARRTDLTPRVLSLVEDGDPDPLRSWLAELGVRPEKPVRLV